MADNQLQGKDDQAERGRRCQSPVSALKCEATGSPLIDGDRVRLA